MSDLVTWLRAALDEHERIARAAARKTGYGPDRGFDWSASDDGDVMPTDAQGNDWIAVGPWNSSLWEVGAHIAANDPAHVLRAVQAHRQLVDLHRPTEEVSEAADGRRYASWGCLICDEPELCQTLRLVAGIYRDRAGFDPAWLPES